MSLDIYESTGSAALLYITYTLYKYTANGTLANLLFVLFKKYHRVENLMAATVFTYNIARIKMF